VSLDRPHSTGVESATHTSSAHSVVSRANAPITQRIVSGKARNRLLYPDCCGRYGNNPRRCAWAWRIHRASEVNPSSACITASVTSSASDSFGAIPTGGRHGAICGEAFSRSSTFT